MYVYIYICSVSCESGESHICGSQELKMQIISEVEVEKMVIENDIQMHDNASGTCACIAYHCVENRRAYFWSLFEWNST